MIEDEMEAVGVKRILLLLCLLPVVALAGADDRAAVWVYFTDRGVAGEELVAALDRAAGGLDERCLRRRAKMTAHGRARLVDATDLPPHRGYIDRVLATGARLRHESRWLNAASVEATAGQRRRIEALDCVARVEPVARRAPRVEATSPAPKASSSAKYTIDYGSSLTALEQIRVPAVHEAGYTGAGVVIGMIDSGFRTAHESLVGVDVLATWDFVEDDANVDTEEGDPATSHYHGTYTLSMVGGLAPGHLAGPAFDASYLLARTEHVDVEEPFEEDNWVAAIEWLEAEGADVVSSSVGYYDWYDFEDLDGATAPCTIAADLAAGKGVVVVNSAGNWRATFGHIFAPADGDSVITVGAVTADGVYTNFSSPGPTWDGRIKPDVCALGFANHLASPTNNEAYVSSSGTSFAAPLAAGVAALVLDRAPMLTPMQVREAMRQTADHADSPDNDYGWGILDAEAAVMYFGPHIEHEPVGDMEAPGGAVEIRATITDRVALREYDRRVYWRLVSSSLQAERLVEVGNDVYTATIEVPAGGGTIEYWLDVGDVLFLDATHPAGAPELVHSFFAGPDTVAPTLEHPPLRDQPLAMWPPVIETVARDNIGIAGVRVVWSRNGAPRPDFDLVGIGDDVYSAPLPMADPTVGDEVVYSIVATDASAAANEGGSGPHAFEVIDVAGLVLVIDDGDDGGLVDEKFGAAKEPVVAKSGASNADSLAVWLGRAGYAVSVLPAAEATSDALAGYNAVVLSCGDNTVPLAGAGLRSSLLEWVRDGGRLFVEGGEIGYDTLYWPGYEDIAAEVLHADAWFADDGGDLGVAADHPVSRSPNDLGTILPVDFADYGDQDVVAPAADARLVFASSSSSERAGLLVFDDNEQPQAVQIVYCAASLGVIADAPLLVENVLACLLAPETPSTASVIGRITLAGSTDHSLIEVSLAGATAITGAIGGFYLENLPAGTWTLRASRAGWSTVTREVVLVEDEMTGPVEFVMREPMRFDLGATPAVPIPDFDPEGVASVISVEPESVPAAPPFYGPLSGLTVSIDLSHSWVSDLTIDLTSPAGTTVRLHDRSGGATADLVGTWGVDFEVDGPGSLEGLAGETVFGDWTLRVADHVGSDTGVLKAWTLHFECVDEVTAVPGDTPARTVLHGAAPNPFNPRTVIAFDLAAAGPMRLTIFDLRGRAVRHLVDEHREAGTHRIAWDGRDDAGRALASGSYLCRLEADKVLRQSKMLLLR